MHIDFKQIMTIFEKQLEELAKEDLELLIGLQERYDLEFKSSEYGRTEPAVKEMLKDISAMANAHGGHLLIGITEDDEGRAEEILGIESAEEEGQRVMNICLSCIDPKIPGIKTHSIKVSDKRSVLAIHVPRSHRAPHMVSGKGVYRFFVRHDRSIDHMSVEEIRDSVLKNRYLVEDLKEFLKERRTEILERRGRAPMFYLTATPPLTLENEILDASDPCLRELILSMPPSIEGVSVDRLQGGSLLPTMNGLMLSMRELANFEIFRNGHVEAIYSLEELELPESGPGKKFFYSHVLVNYPVFFIELVRRIAEHIGLEEPMALTVWFLNVGDFYLSGKPRPLKAVHGAPAVSFCAFEQHIEDLTAPKKLGELIADRIWNSFGFEKAEIG